MLILMIKWLCNYLIFKRGSIHPYPIMLKDQGLQSSMNLDFTH